VPTTKDFVSIIRRTSVMRPKTIISLYDYTGEALKPWAKAGQLKKIKRAYNKRFRKYNKENKCDET